MDQGNPIQIQAAFFLDAAIGPTAIAIQGGGGSGHHPKVENVACLGMPFRVGRVGLIGGEAIKGINALGGEGMAVHGMGHPPFP